MAVRIITDSTVDIADKYRNLFSVVPLTVSFGEKDYRSIPETSGKRR